MPILIIAPDITAAAWLGAAGSASGSDTCSGINPAFVPKPTSASRNNTFVIRGVTTGAAAAILSKSSELAPWPSRTKNAKRNAAPRCIAMRYRRPASRTLCFSLSKVTRKYDASDITSQATRNRMPLRTTSTMIMPATSKLKKNQGGPSSFQLRYASRKRLPNTAARSDNASTDVRNRAESGSSSTENEP